MEGKNNNNWGWFMACIREYITDRLELCVIFYCHAGIMNTINDQYSGWIEPFAYHQFYMRHFATNFYSHFRDKSLKNKLKTIVTQRQIRKFEKSLRELI